MSAIELVIQRKVETGYPVIASLTREDGALPLRREGTLALDFSALGDLTDDERLEYGIVLGKALFVYDIRDTFREGLAENETLHVHLCIEAPDLRSIYWHRLAAPFDGGTWRFLAAQQRTPFSLDVPSPARGYFPAIGHRDLRALILVAGVESLSSKYKLAAFDVAATTHSIQTALGNIPHDVLTEPTLDALCAKLTATPYTILHVVCHGAVNDQGETVLYFPKDSSGSPVRATELLNRLENVKHLPHFAFITACESALPQNGLGNLAQRLIRELGLPAALAMTERVSIDTAQALIQPFYTQLFKHGQPDIALAEALAGLQGKADVTVPALFSRMGDRPLFSDSLERDLTTQEIEFGLATLPGLFAERAPILQHERPPVEFNGQPLVLMEPLETLDRRLRETLGADLEALSETGRTVRKEALSGLNRLCLEVLDFSFNALCIGQTPPAYDSRSPFRALESFRPEDKDFFFGRDPLTKTLVGKLNEHPFLAVLGASGSGKSSLVMAGLVPAMAVSFAIFRPGANPLAELEKAIQSGPEVLVVDQFEELFTVAGEKTAADFLPRLLEQVGKRRVVITLRMDFLSEAARFQPLRDQIQNHQQIIASMDTAELRRAMDGQAGRVGLRFEPGLSQQILDDVAGEPGAMPLLQHALWELWKRRHGHWLRADEYYSFGGVRHAITGTAEEVFARYTPAEQTRLQDIFLRLTRLDREGTAEDETRRSRDTRRRIAIKDLIPARGAEDQPDTTALLKRLTDARLVVISGDEVEIAHEALIRHWDRLQNWLHTEREALLAYQHLQQSAREWADAKRPRDLLYPASRLKAVAALRYSLNADEVAFMAASQANQKRQAWQRYALWGVTAILVGILLAAFPLRLAYYEFLRQQVIQASPMVFLKGGTIIFGTDDPERDIEEPALQKVDVGNFSIEVFEVTNQNYHACVDVGVCEKPKNTEFYDDELKYGKHPVVYVTLDQAKIYCTWLGRRLPTTFEWERAARGLNGRKWPLGDEQPEFPTKESANVITLEGDWIYPKSTLPVGSFAKVATNNVILDLVGNVWEWTDTALNEGGYIQRGGGWKTLIKRITIVRPEDKNGYDEEVGFRCIQ